jgi:PAS domain S-box-containing protein
MPDDSQPPVAMNPWFERLPIRAQVALPTLAVLFPAAGGLAWWLASGLPQAGADAAGLRQVIGIALAAALALLALALALAWRLGTAIVRPLAGLAQTAARVAAGEPALRAGTDGPPEAAAAAREFNRVLDARDADDAALRASEAGLRRLLTLLPEAVIFNHDHRISFVNEAAQRLLGADEASLLGRPATELFGAGSIAVEKSRVQALHASAAVSPPIEERIRRADGANRIVETTATLIDEHGASSILAVMRDVTELKQAQAALIESHTDLQRLLAAQDSVQENERQRIARELHDDLQQTLAVIRIDLGVIATRLATDPAGVAAMLAGVDAHAEAAIASTRRIVNDLRPQMLEDLGLVAALETMSGRLARRAGMACHLEVKGEAGAALLEAPAVTTCLYRVAQEALNNVLKHAQASTVNLVLERLADGRVALRIGDNGRGIGVGEPHKRNAFGLRGIAERVRALGGVLRVDSPPGAGTTIEVIVPVPGKVSPPPPEPRDPRVGDNSQHGAPRTEAAGETALLQAVIDALAGNVAVLDGDGTIEIVNRAWREFAEGNGDPGMKSCGPGANYLEVCRRSALSDKGAERVLHGLNALLDGRQQVFVSEYPCDAPDEQRWFRLHAAPMAGGKFLLTHFNLTAWVGQARKGEAGPAAPP